MNVSTQHKVVNDAIEDINKGLDALGKDPIDHLEGVRGCSRRCLVAGFGGTRARFDGARLTVRSIKQAKALAETWGTDYNELSSSIRKVPGFKDYRAVVNAPKSLTEIAEHFDEGKLSGVESFKGWAYSRRGDSDPIYTVRSTRKVAMPVSTVELSADQAVQLVQGVFGV